MKVIAKFAGDYLSQRDNHIIYYIDDDGWVYDFDGKRLFPASKIEEKKDQLKDRNTQCFISSGTMFCNSLFNAKLIKNKLDETAYLVAITNNIKDKETRTHWNVHKTVINKLLEGTNYKFDYKRVSSNEKEIKLQIDFGFPVIVSIWIKPWLPHAKGHLVIVRGYIVNEEGEITHFILDDPFGNYFTRYKDKNGSSIEVPISDWEKMIASPVDSPRMFSFLIVVE